MTDKFIFCSAEFKRLFNKVLNPTMTSLKDALKLALASKNKQNHRFTGDSKRGRQHLAETKNQCDVKQNSGAHIEQSESRDSRSRIKGAVGKRDI